MNANPNRAPLPITSGRNSSQRKRGFVPGGSGAAAAAVVVVCKGVKQTFVSLKTRLDLLDDHHKQTMNTATTTRLRQITLRQASGPDFLPGRLPSRLARGALRVMSSSVRLTALNSRGDIPNHT